MNRPSDASIVLAAFTHKTMTVEILARNTMMSQRIVSDALQDLLNQGRVSVAGGAWTLINQKKGSSEVTTLKTKKAPAKKAAPAKKVPAKKAAPAKKATKTLVAKKPAAPKDAVKKNAVAAANGAKKHVKVAERDAKVLSIIAGSKKAGVTDEEIAKALGVPLGLAYHSIRRLKDEGKIDSRKGDNGVTRRYAA